MENQKTTDPNFIKPGNFWHRHLLAELLSIFAGLAAVSVVYFIWQSVPADTSPILPVHHPMATWKTYTATQFGFDVRIPNDWVVDSRTFKNEICFASPAKNESMKNPNFEGTCGELVFGQQSYLSTATPGSVKQVTLGNNTFTNYKGGATYESDSYVLNRGSDTYNFETAGGGLVTQILSTFKFTDTADTSTWKTYTNTQYGFEVKLPPDWIAEETQYSEIAFDSPTAQKAKPEYLKTMEEIKNDSAGTDCCPPYYDFVFTATTEKPKPDNIKMNDEKAFTNANGFKFIQYDLIGSMWGGSFYTTDRDNKIYNFEMVQGEENILRQILSTFKFTDSSQNTVKGQGILSGHVTIGPICPVQQDGYPCEPTPEMYTSHEVTVYASDSKTIITKKNLDEQGNFSFNLDPGNYFLNVTPAGIAKDSMHAATLSADKTTTVNINIDTGIR